MELHHTPRSRTRRPPPLRVTAEVAWVRDAVVLAARRWKAGRKHPVLCLELGDLIVVVGPVLRGTHYLVHRTERAVAPTLTIGDHVHRAEPAARARIVAQGIGVAVGIAIAPLHGEASIMTQLPVRLDEVVAASSTTAERAALKQQLRWHFLERIRLNDAPPVEVGADGKLIGHWF